MQLSTGHVRNVQIIVFHAVLLDRLNAILTVAALDMSCWEGYLTARNASMAALPAPLPAPLNALPVAALSTSPIPMNAYPVLQYVWPALHRPPVSLARTTVCYKTISAILWFLGPAKLRWRIHVLSAIWVISSTKGAVKLIAAVMQLRPARHVIKTTTCRVANAWSVRHPVLLVTIASHPPRVNA